MADRYQELFELAPAALCEVDFTLAMTALADMPDAQGQRAAPRSPAALQAALEANPEAVSHLASRLTLCNANLAAIELLAAPSKEALQAGATALWVPESRPLVIELVVALARGERRVAAQGIMAALDGRRITAELSLAVLPGAPGEHRAMMSLAVQQALHEPMRAVFEALPHPMWASDASGMLGGCTRALVELTGLSSDELVGGDWLALVHPDERSSVAEGRRAAREASTPYRGECRLRAGGDYIGVHVSEAPMTDERGAIAGWSGVLTDVSELLQARDQLRGALERSHRELTQIAYAASHDLQEPLRMVTSYGQLLLQRYEHQLDERADKYFGYMIEGAKRIRRLILDMLALANVSVDGRELKPASANRIVDMVTMGLEAELESCDATITREELPVVMADAKQLSHVFGNLFANSLKFHGQQPPRIHVSAERDGPLWRFAVTDSGMGFDAQAHSERIFQMFQRLHHRSKFPGTGIGLTLVRKIVERHGGRIWAESAPDCGATFYFTLPGVP